MNLKNVLCCLALAASTCFGAVVTLPGGILSIPATSGAGMSFSYSGTLTQNDTINLSQAGLACLQGGGAYCTNGAGVVVLAGSSSPGQATTFSGTFGGFSGTFDFGAILMVISGVGVVQIFPANSANGLGSPTPPPSLTLPSTTLGALGFGTFSVTNPTITFVVADTLYTDNSGTATLTQSPSVIPAPGTLTLVLLGLLASGLFCAYRYAWIQSRRPL